jgi:hypothetical protein
VAKCTGWSPTASATRASRTPTGPTWRWREPRKAGAVGALVLAPHTIALGVVGLGLIVFGLTALALGLANL